jgi:hypothetical protein
MTSQHKLTKTANREIAEALVSLAQVCLSARLHLYNDVSSRAEIQDVDDYIVHMLGVIRRQLAGPSRRRKVESC